jgi:hypothetical protein
MARSIIRTSGLVGPVVFPKKSETRALCVVAEQRETAKRLLKIDRFLRHTALLF